VVLGRTRSELWRHYATLAVMVVMLLAVAIQNLGSWVALAALLAGAVVGGLLGQLSMKKSRLENRADGFFYTQDRKLGLLVIMLFISRLIYRLFEAYLHMHNGLALDPDFLGQPITAWLFGLLGGFYGVYATLLVKWRKTQKPVPRPIDIFDIK
jgi:hypothetical protein